MEPSPSPVTFGIYKKAHEAADKFDYFVCSVAGAIFAYDAEHYIPRRFGFDVHLFEPVSLLLLALAFFFGLQKLEHSVHGTHINHDLNDSEEKSCQLAEMLKDPKYDEAARQILLRDIQKHRLRVNTLETQLTKASVLARRNYIWRDTFLILGFLAILCAKFLEPYASDVSGVASATNQTAQIQSQIARPMSSQATPKSTPATNRP